MREIALTKGKIALVSDVDFDKLGAFRWYTQESQKPGKKPRFYACRRMMRDGKSVYIYMHREVLQCMGFSEFKNSDHKNGCTLDNRRNNLRPATVAQNNANKRSECGASGYRGVIKRSNLTSKPFRAAISIDNRTVNLGYFETAEEAARAYDKAAVDRSGEFAVLNFPDEGLGA